ncbi:adenylate cyclase [Mangrovimonas yunxiaonensis]|uniref:Adenylate cyclase n=1 Tax=Mangrovimonas yunxiaonensis TaxID=1197477 RepID=A0A084TKW9_9FLAO|nr:CYTH domain-containing protein [Mangrovimonas yunxiaonensis]KFB01355.1 adenylate cyclase [Mangrovimonas yunxiaonensis]MBR9757539.1 CYTH domain-containing protein [Algicola sp.]GGH37185.1 CYTH domain-containing protein [Mangrovimonas yunxiaonensis]
MIEIERKFLVTSNAFKDEAVSKTRIVQGFLNTHPERTVRVRIKGDKGVLTVKGKSSEDGTSRFEWETPIAKADAENLLKLCEEGIIDKTRYEVVVENHTFEIDEFYGANAGLTVAEVELGHANETFKTPDWLGVEVTGQPQYYNSQLSKHPFKTWNNTKHL